LIRDVLLEEHAHILLQQFDNAIVSSLDEPLGPAVDFGSFDPALLSYANRHPANIAGDGPGLLHSEFERQARDNPSHSALEYLSKDGEIIAWTFEKLNQTANQVAHYLISKGVKRDEAIPLCLEKSPLFYICALGVLKAGAAFTPIDPALPPQRKLFMLGELGARVAIATDVTAQDLLLPVGLELVDIERESLITSQPVANPVIEDLSVHCLAYRLYTSGSTGQPKAVSVEIRSAVQTFRASMPMIPWHGKSRLLQFAATTFDMCYYDCFMAWSYGFTLCSADKSHLLGDLEGTIRKLRVSMLDLTPTVASTLHAENLPEVELLYCIGEAMPQKLTNDWDGRCINSYGPTGIQ
jgi:non-ribosomal peptide synthetase component F